jgi:hypothetical protein
MRRAQKALRKMTTVLETTTNLTTIPLPTPEMSGDELFRLGMLYSTGQNGAPLDLISAHMMFNLASMKGSQEATIYRRELSREMEREDIAEAQKCARVWLDQGPTTKIA